MLPRTLLPSLCNLSLRRLSLGSLFLGFLALLALPALAQHDRGGFHPGTAGRTGTYRTPQIYRGGTRGTVRWGDFHHDNAPARIAPRRFGQTFLPRPNNWRGDFRNFEFNRWRAGYWRHVNHGGRLGWWWVVGPSWYYFDRPVYPYPDLYTPYGVSLGWWYWCDPLQQYYPYVTSCPGPWESVMPRD